MENHVQKKLNAFLKSLKDPKIKNNYQKEKEAIKRKSDALRKLQVSSVMNSQFIVTQGIRKCAFKSTEPRFQWQTKYDKGEEINGKKGNHHHNEKNYSQGKWDQLLDKSDVSKPRRLSKVSSLDRFKTDQDSVRNIITHSNTSFDGNTQDSYRFGRKMDYDPKLKDSAHGSLKNLLDLTPRQTAFGEVANPKKYFKRVLSMSSDIFNDELPKFKPVLNFIDQGKLKDSRDLAGNYRVDPPTNEFHDPIYVKNKFGFIFRPNYDYSEHKYSVRSGSTSAINSSRYNSNVESTVNYQKQTSTNANERALKSYDSMGKLTKGLHNNHSEATTIHSKTNSYTKPKI
jgi:hypothetical protein